jgi:hypothetical protein
MFSTLSIHSASQRDDILIQLFVPFEDFDDPNTGTRRYRGTSIKGGDSS